MRVAVLIALATATVATTAPRRLSLAAEATTADDSVSLDAVMADAEDAASYADACTSCSAAQRLVIDGEEQYRRRSESLSAIIAVGNATDARVLAAVETQKLAVEAQRLAAKALKAASDAVNAAKLEHEAAVISQEGAAEELKARTKATRESKTRLDVHIAAAKEHCEDVLPSGGTGGASQQRALRLLSAAVV